MMLHNEELCDLNMSLEVGIEYYIQRGTSWLKRVTHWIKLGEDGVTERGTSWIFTQLSWDWMILYN